MDPRLQTAIEHFENEEYNQAFELAFELYKAGVEPVETALLSAKSYLFLLKSPMNPTSNNSFYSTVGFAVDAAKTIEEIWHIETAVAEMLDAWQEKADRYQLAVLCVEPTFEKYQEYLKHAVEYVKMSIFATMKTRGESQIVQDFCAEKGIELKEYVKTYVPQYEKKYTGSEVRSMRCAASERIFDKVPALLEKNLNGTAADFPTRATAVGGALFIAKSLADAKDETSDVSKLYYLKQRATVLDYTLRATLNANGHACSLSRNGRDEEIAELRGIYGEILLLDPNFTVPALPSSAPILPPQTSSGGCYVATAVYGSYDCPEVWTLRRYRDDTLASSWYGRLFIRSYYAISPTLVKWFGKTEWFKNMWKPTLDRMVEKLNANGVESTPYNDRNY